MLDQLLKHTQEKTGRTVAHFKTELNKLRTSRANPALIEDIEVEAYDSGKMLLKELAAISTPDPQTLLVVPWDPSIVSQIESALRQSPLGLNPSTFDVNIRVPIPTLTQERRAKLIKLVSAKSEEAKVAVRNIRHEKFKSLDEQCDEGIVSEDERQRCKKELEEHFEKINQEIDRIRGAKEKELRSV